MLLIHPLIHDISMGNNIHKKKRGNIVGSHFIYQIILSILMSGPYVYGLWIYNIVILDSTVSS